MKKQYLLLSIVIFLLAGCSQTTQTGNPIWVDRLIREFENNPTGNPPLSIWRYEYNEQVVYFVPAHCCDISSVVYDENGNYICAPDGGLTGDGDGRCTDFFSHRTNEQLIWQDPR